MRSLNTFLSLILLPITSFALVDYGSGDSTNRFEKPRAVSKRAAPPPQRAARAASTGPKFLDMGIRYEGLDVKSQGPDESSGKIDVLSIGGRIETQSKIFVEFDYWQASSKDENLAEGSSLQQGNPRVILGFNWLQLGAVPDGMNLDVYGGGKFKTNSDFASSRNDTIFGVSTTKRIDNFVIGIGFEYTLSGNPKNEDHAHIGNMRKLKAALGWLVSPDIRFVLEGESTKVAASENDEFVNRLEDDVSFSSITPKVELLIGPSMGIEFGSTFRTRKAASDNELTSAKLLDEAGSYGNSIFAALKLSI